MATRYEVCPAAELPPGERRIVDVDEEGLSVGVFNVAGEYYALANVCPHQLGPLCEGTITGEVRGDRPGDFELVREGEVVRCPWHGWKFDIRDGTSVFNPHGLSTPTYEAGVEPSSATKRADDAVDRDRDREREQDQDQDQDQKREQDTEQEQDSDRERERERGQASAKEEASASDADEREVYGTALAGEEPPVDTYDVAVEDAVVVVYV